MSKLIATRTTQFVQAADFNFNYNDWVTDTVALTKVTLGATVAVADPNGTVAGLTGAAANTVTFDCIPLPPGAVITGGEVIVETAFVGPTACTLSLGIAGALTGEENAVSLLATGRTAVTLGTPLVSQGGQNLRLTYNYTVANATAGRVRIRIQYTIDGKMHETCIV